MDEKDIKDAIYEVENKMQEIRFDLSEAKNLDDLLEARIAFSELEGMRKAYLFVLGLTDEL
ncbi:hypothetical protein KO465_05275 [Candidatus Micrarchaeota archaeon]|jgi:hypothetical protein|nr:hypothetical protein [Candidatus Micrarchaeota archaeon]